MRHPSEIGAAVIGSGFIGTVHIEALRRLGVQVHGLLGSSPERGAASAKRIGVAKAYASLDELLADDGVEVVHVTSPNHLHHPQVRRIRSLLGYSGAGDKSPLPGEVAAPGWS